MKFIRPIRFIFPVLVILLIISTSVSAKNGEKLNLVAYPNPFDTDKQVLTIQEKKNGVLRNFNAQAQVTIYNYAGKVVFTGNFSGRIRWSGFDKGGNRLAPGVYFIKMLFRHNNGGVNTQWTRVAIK